MPETPQQALTRFMVSAGGTKLPGSDSTFLLYVEDSNLKLKEWNGTTFDSQELIASDARPDSLALYLTPSDSSKRIIYISSASTLGSLIYDEDSEEWVDEESLGQHKVHPNGKVAGSIGTDGSQHVFFQNSANKLVHLDDKYKATILTVGAIAGSPLAVLAFDDGVYLFYISTSDNLVHSTAQQGDGTWGDSVLTTFAFDANDKPTRLLISPSEDGALDLFVLSEKKSLFRVSADGTKTVLGSVTDAGEWKAATNEECFLPFMFHAWHHHLAAMHRMHMMHGMRRMVRVPFNSS
jgi:hypothetical protein